MIRILLPALLLSLACSHRAPAPSADAPQQGFPDMAGRAVFVLPVQSATPVLALPAGSTATALSAADRAALDAEIAYWLANSAPRVRWTHADAVERAVQRAPTLGVHVRDLPVQDFVRARLTSVGDPLYGEIRKIGALLDTRPALLPFAAAWVQEDAGSGRVHVALALVDTTGGTVHWYGVVAGGPGARADAATIASAAQAVARLVAGS